MTLTKKQKKKYMINNGNICPFCESEEISADHADFDDCWVWRKVECNQCKKQWVDIYKLVDIEDVDE